MHPPRGLCVGLDPVLERFPRHLSQAPTAAAITAFLVPIIESTRPYAAAYKINVAFFEQYGLEGVKALYAVREAVAESYCIIDAKRGDIGSTSAAYAQAVFNDPQADAVTVAPYMGSDSVEPFLAFEGKVVYVLALTSNPGSADIQRLDVHGTPLYEHVMHAALSWKGLATRGFVVGATHPDELRALRDRFHEVPFLIPGIGTQGGDVASVVDANAGGPALFNSSRGILYAHDGEDYARAAADVAQRLASGLERL